MKDNPVAKHAHKFNKSAVHKDKKKALKKGERKHKGSYESVEEKLNVSDGIAAWIKDFQSSDAPQFKGKTKEERREMAIAAYMSAKRGGNPQNESVDEGKKMDSAAMKKAMDVFRKRGGKITKVAPGKAAGYHGKDDPGKGMHGIMDRGDTKGMPRKKKIRSMR